MKCAARTAPKVPAANRVRRVAELRDEGQDVRHHEQFPRAPGRGDHCVGVRGRQRNRLLDEDVLAGPQRLYGQRRVLIGNGADIDEIDGRVGQ